jgi:hypothetical protein
MRALHVTGLLLIPSLILALQTYAGDSDSKLKEFENAPVVHSHGYGSCDGTLAIRRTGISYRDAHPRTYSNPYGVIDHSFNWSFARIADYEFVDNRDGHRSDVGNSMWLTLYKIDSKGEKVHAASFVFRNYDDFRRGRDTMTELAKK